VKEQKTQMGKMIRTKYGEIFVGRISIKIKKRNTHLYAVYIVTWKIEETAVVT
jgi:hypothetical protein